MFRAEVQQLPSGPTLKMEGRLVGDCAEQVRSAITNGAVQKGLIVDVSDVTYIDSVGERVLNWFASLGALFAADEVYAAEVCERLQLPLRSKFCARNGDYRENAYRRDHVCMQILEHCSASRLRRSRH